MALRLNMGMGERWGASRDRLRDHGCTGRDRQDSSHYLLLLLLLSYFSHIWPCATHRWQSTRLLHPWDSQGKNPGVGYHFLLQCEKVKSLSRVQLLATPWTAAYQAPLSIRFSRQEYWSGLPFPSPGHLPDSGIKPRSPSLYTDALPSEPPGKSWIYWGTCYNPDYHR